MSLESFNMRKFEILKNWKKYFILSFIYIYIFNEERFRANCFNIYKKSFYVIKQVTLFVNVSLFIEVRVAFKFSK